MDTQDAEDLINEFDVELESYFDVHIGINRSNQVSFDINDPTVIRGSGTFGMKPKNKLSSKCKSIECDLMDAVPPNCCLLEIKRALIGF